MSLPILCGAVRMLHPKAEVRLRMSGDLWVCSVEVPGIILVETEPSGVEEVVSKVSEEIQKFACKLCGAFPRDSSPCAVAGDSCPSRDDDFKS